MKGYAILLKLSVRNRFAGLRKGSWYQDDGKLNISTIALTSICVLAAIAMAGLLLGGEIWVFQGLAAAGQPMLLPALTFVLAMAITLVFGLITAVSGLYFGKDNAWKAYLPVSSTAVLASRWTEIYLWEMLINAFVIGPAAVMYGIHIQGGVLYYIRALMIILATPLLPLTIATVLATLLVRVAGLSRHRDSLMLIGSLLLMGAVLVFQFSVMSKVPEDADAVYFAQLIQDSQGLVTALLSSIPPLMWAVAGLEGQWLQTLLFVGVSGALVVLLMALLGPRYMSICLQQGEQGTKARRVVFRKDTWSVRSPLVALMQREMRELIRTPVYALNSFSNIILVPIMLVSVSVSLSSIVDEGVNGLMVLQELMKDVSGMDFLLVLTGVLALSCFINPAAATSISREGKRVGVSRMIPIAYGTQMKAKVLLAMGIDLLSQVVVVIILAFILRSYAIWLLPALLLATLYSYTSTVISLLMEAVRPKLKWMNENQVMKQNTNVIFSMLLNLVLLAVPIALAVLLHAQPHAVRFAVSIGSLLLESVIAALLMRLVVVRRYAELEG